MGNPSTIWTQLATPNPAAGSIPFVDVDNITIITDVVNFFYDPVTDFLNLAKGVKAKQVLPTAATNCALGSSTAPFDGLFLTFSDNVGTAATSGASGNFQINQGTSSKVVTNTRVVASSQIILTVKYGGNGGTVTAVTPAAGQFTITLQANASTNMVFNYLVLNPAAIV